MYHFQVLLICYFSISSVCSYPTIQDQNGDTFLIIPFNHNHRIRRQSVSIPHKQNLFENDKHKVDGSVSANKPSTGPLTLGGQVDYTHKPTGSGVSVSGANTRGFGTDLKATGNYNFYQSKNGRTTAGVAGEYGRHFGGPQGTGQPNYGVFGTLKYKF